jgi:hypothetical protein
LPQIRVHAAVDLGLAPQLRQAELSTGHGPQLRLELLDHPGHGGEVLLLAHQPIGDVIADHRQLRPHLRGLLLHVRSGALKAPLQFAELALRLRQAGGHLPQHRVARLAEHVRFRRRVRALERALHVAQRADLQQGRDAYLPICSTIASASFSSTTTRFFVRKSASFSSERSSECCMPASCLVTNDSTAVASSVFQDWRSSR